MTRRMTPGGYATPNPEISGQIHGGACQHTEVDSMTVRSVVYQDLLGDQVYQQ